MNQENNITPLMYALRYNQSENLNLNLNEEQIDYLNRNSDLKQQNNNGYTPLIYVFAFKKTQNLKLKTEQFDYLIKNSDLKQKNKYGRTPLMYALRYNKTQNLKLKNKHFQTIYDALDEKQKQITFQNLIQRNIENNKKYQEEINLFLYNLQFQPHEKTIHWLKENQHQDILEMIEKRDLFFQLNKDLKEINKHKKIATIKL